MQQKSTNIISKYISSLSEHYLENRPNYLTSFLSDLTGLIKKPILEIEFFNVGTGTGICTRMVANLNLKSVTSIEPNFKIISRYMEICK